MSFDLLNIGTFWGDRRSIQPTLATIRSSGFDAIVQIRDDLASQVISDYVQPLVRHVPVDHSAFKLEKQRLIEQMRSPSIDPRVSLDANAIDFRLRIGFVFSGAITFVGRGDQVDARTIWICTVSLEGRRIARDRSAASTDLPQTLAIAEETLTCIVPVHINAETPSYSFQPYCNFADPLISFDGSHEAFVPFAVIAGDVARAAFRSLGAIYVSPHVHLTGGVQGQLLRNAGFGQILAEVLPALTEALDRTTGSRRTALTMGVRVSAPLADTVPSVLTGFVAESPFCYFTTEELIRAVARIRWPALSLRNVRGEAQIPVEVDGVPATALGRFSGAFGDLHDVRCEIGLDGNPDSLRLITNLELTLHSITLPDGTTSTDLGEFGRPDILPFAIDLRTTVPESPLSDEIVALCRSTLSACLRPTSDAWRLEDPAFQVDAVSSTMLTRGALVKSGR